MTTKVLLVDDCPDLLETMATLLRLEERFQIEAAISARKALSILSEFKPDVIVTDLMMPGIGGIDLIKRVRETESPAKIIAVSGIAELETEAVAAGASAFRLKPIDLDDLIGMIDALAQNRPKPPERRSIALERRREASDRAQRALVTLASRRPRFKESAQRGVGILAAYFGGVPTAIAVLERDTISILASSHEARIALGTAADPLLKLADDVIASGSSLIVPDLRQFPSLFRRSPQSQLQFLVAIPIRVPQGQSIGCLLLLDDEPRAFDSSDHAILQNVGSYMTDALQPASEQLFFTPSGFLSARIWRKWLEAELTRVADQRVLQLTRIETVKREWDEDGARRVLRSVPPRSAISEIEPKTLLVYEVAEEGLSPSNLDRVIGEIEATMGIAFESRVLLADLDLAGRLYVVLDLSEALLESARRRGRRSRVDATLRPTRH